MELVRKTPKRVRRKFKPSSANIVQISSLESTDRSLRAAADLVEDKTLTVSERLEFLKAIIDLQNGIRLMCESALAMTKKPKEAKPSSDSASEPQQPQPSVNRNYIPAVATKAARRIGPVDANGERVL